MNAEELIEASRASGGKPVRADHTNGLRFDLLNRADFESSSGQYERARLVWTISGADWMVELVES